MKSKNMKIELKNLNIVTKILLIILVVAISYLIIFLALRPFFAPASMMDMMSQVTGGIGTRNIVPFIIALVIGIIISFYLFNKDRDKREEEFKILRKALSDDEKKILDEIKKSGKITQDSLRFRLDWSKAKTSTILTNLDKRNLIQRQRTGKTYIVYLQKVR